METFVKDILEKHCPGKSQEIYDNSLLIQYLDKKSNAIHGNVKTRRSYANYYAIYSILFFYVGEFFNNKDKYKQFTGYEFSKLFAFSRTLYGGSKLQNHALNNRVNAEFERKFHSGINIIIRNESRYALHVKYLYVGNYDISKIAKEIIETYVELLRQKDCLLSNTLKKMLNEKDGSVKRNMLANLLNEDAEARIFEILSYAILKNHYKSMSVYIGYSIDSLQQRYFELFKTGKTNANDGGIDFVMRPIGRFFQVTEVGDYDKYLLDMDKTLHFPITFVIKSSKSKEEIHKELEDFINEKSGGMQLIIDRYHSAIEEIITINEIKAWMDDLSEAEIDEVINDIVFYYKMELNLT